jgi:hypothetical protein
MPDHLSHLPARSTPSLPGDRERKLLLERDHKPPTITPQQPQTGNDHRTCGAGWPVGIDRADDLGSVAGVTQNGSSSNGASKPNQLKEFEPSIAGLGLNDLQNVLDDLLGQGNDISPFERQPPPSRRRPPRDDVVTYRVRVDLAGTKPPLWRRLELASDMTLDDVHEVIQTAFGWTDSHLHRFASGPAFHSPETEYYLCEFEVDEGEVGIPEEDVRLDEVLVEPGEKLLYNYDFGDDWEHVIKLEAVEPRNDDAPRALCTGGKRPAPAEDCGGVHGYELFVAANSEPSTERDRAIAELTRIYGADIDVT